MPVKIRSHKVRPHRITQEAISAFRAGDQRALHTALDLPPWCPSPLDVSENGCPWPAGSAGATAWPLALKLRSEVEKSK